MKCLNPSYKCVDFIKPGREKIISPRAKDVYYLYNDDHLSVRRHLLFTIIFHLHDITEE